MAERQQQTRDWWQTNADYYDLYSSEPVRLEAGRGDGEMAQKRLDLIDSVKMLPVKSQAETLAQALIDLRILPSKAKIDSLHLAVATVEKMNFLITWNCAHLANGDILEQVMKRWRALGYDVPQVVTPEQLPGVIQ